VLRIAPTVRQQSKAVVGRENTLTNVRGVTPEYGIVRDYKNTIGSFIRDVDVLERARVALSAGCGGQAFSQRRNTRWPHDPRCWNSVSHHWFAGREGRQRFWQRDDVIMVTSTAQERLSTTPTRRGEQHRVHYHGSGGEPGAHERAAEQITEYLRERHKIAFVMKTILQCSARLTF